MLLHFVVGSSHLALPLSEVREVLLVPEMVRTPNRPAFIEGVFSLGGTAVPVIRLSALLQLPEKEVEPYDHILLLKNGNGLLVDGVRSLIASEQGSTISVPTTLSFNKCVAECLRLDGYVVAILSLEHLLLEEEHRRVADFKKLEQARLGAVNSE